MNSSSSLRPLMLSIALAVIAAPAYAASAVTLREVDEVIPTYLSGAPDPNPMFYFGRQSQGAKGHIYPYPLYNNLTNQKADRTYHLVYLENEFVKIAIAPEIGGRLLSAVDKTDNYDFVYHQHVIKPALIGLIGAWISGGIEWNIPHHHRASTFLSVQYRTEENADGSKTVWVGELEVRHRMRWAVGYTLRPGSSVLECSVRILNRTPLVNTMLCFANLAVNANEQYQIIFPPSTQWVVFHAKNQFSAWPISHQRYASADFTPGVDVSWYKNHVSANSMFAWNYRDDFFAGYDHGREAGTMSVADHHIVPAKKFWTWGNGPRGRMWDQILTDTDGPYIELMVGAYSDNQPDYSWLQPFETRAFQMNWYPFRGIGGVKNANLAAAVNLDVQNGVAHFGFCTTRAHTAAMARLQAGSRILVEEQITINPGKPYTKQVPVPPGVDEHDLRASLSVDGRELVAYSPLRLAPQPQPDPVTPPPAPKDIANEEELFLAGQRIDQFHDPALDADPYWEEALRRDPGEISANTGLGLLALRRARFADAEHYFRKALDRLTAKYTTPKNAEPLYYLGIALKAQNKADEAVDVFYKAAWSQEWKAPAYFSLAQIAAARGDFTAALDLVNRSLDANALNVRAYGLKAAVLRHLGRAAEAQDVVAFAAAKTDPLDVQLMAEQWLADATAAARPPPGGAHLTRADGTSLFANLLQHPATAQELAAEYANAGLWQDATDVLAPAVAGAPDRTKVSPIVYYYLGDFAERLGAAAKAAEYRQFAAVASADYVFPFQWENIPVLRRAIEANPLDARAPYYLGNLLFDWQPDEAVKLWERSVALDPTFPIAWRNLAQAYAHRPGDDNQAKAIACLVKAVALPGADATQFAELDQLYQTTGAPPEKRLALLEQHEATVVQKDEGLARLINLKIFAGKTHEAISLLENHTFNIWEGGTRFNTAESWIDAHVVRGLQRLEAKHNREALADFEVAARFPANLRAIDSGSRTAEIAYWTGCASEALGDANRARDAWTRSAATPATESRPPGGDGEFAADFLFRRSSERYYQALALRKLGEEAKALSILQDLAQTKIDASAADHNLPALAAEISSSQHRKAAARFAAGLGYAGLGNKDKARAEISAALAMVPDNLSARVALNQL